MIEVYIPHDSGLRKGDPGSDMAAAIWVDMLHPTAEEERIVEAALGLNVPTHEEMQEIEISSRLYMQDQAAFMTAVLLVQADTDEPEIKPVTFILAGNRLITVRYSTPKPFQSFSSRVVRPGSSYTTADTTLIGLLEAIVDRTADILEHVSADVNRLSREVLAHKGSRPNSTHNFQGMLRSIGRKGDLNSKVR